MKIRRWAGVFVGAVLLVGACAAFAGDYDSVVLSVTVNAASNGIATDATINGAVQVIKITPATAGATATVSVVAVPIDSTFANVTLASKASCAAEAIYRPLFDHTGATGAVYTAGVGDYFYAAGETLRCIVTNASPTNVVWEFLIKHTR